MLLSQLKLTICKSITELANATLTKLILFNRRSSGKPVKISLAN